MGAQRWRQVLDGAVVVAAGLAVARRPRPASGCPRPRCSAGWWPGWSAPSRSRRRARCPSRRAPPRWPSSASRSARCSTPTRSGRWPGAWAPILLVIVATLALSVVAGLLLRLHRDITPGDRRLLDDRRRGGGHHRDGPRTRCRRAHGRRPAVPARAADRQPHAGRGDRRLRRLVGRAAGRFRPRTSRLAGRAAVHRRLRRCWDSSSAGSSGCRPPAVLGPMLVAAAATLGGVVEGAGVPAPLQAAAFLVIGLQVGLSFTRQSLRTIGRALPLALAIIVGLIVACAGLGAVLAGVPPARVRWTPTSRRRPAGWSPSWPSPATAGPTRRSSSSSRCCGCS